MSHWSQILNCPVIIPHYTLYPDAIAPQPLNEVAEVYKFITTEKEEAAKLLGFSIKRTVVAGESAGANLSAGLTSKLIIDEHGHIPSVLYLTSPALNMSQVPGPSRVFHVFDPVLSIPVTSSIVSTVTSNVENETKDPTMSVYHAPDSVLEKFPPTIVTAGEFDPLMDDGVDFGKKLERLGVDVQLEVYPNLQHGLFSLSALAGRKEEVVDAHAHWIEDLLLFEDGGGKFEENGGETKFE